MDLRTRIPLEDQRLVEGVLRVSAVFRPYLFSFKTDQVKVDDEF
jgi:hypothetical protein